MNRNKKKIIRAVTVSDSIEFFEPIVPDLQKRGYEIISVSSSGPEQENLKEKGVKIVSVKMERHISLINDLKALIHLIRVFLVEKPFMVHSMTPKAGLLCMIASWISRVPRRVHTFTGLVWPTSVGLKRKILMATDWITCACATHIIPEGEGVKADLQTHITNKPMKVLGYGNVRGIDMKRWQVTPEIKTKSSMVKDGRFTFLFVGRIVGDKGVNELIEAFMRLQKSHNSIRLLLVGYYENDIDPVSETTQALIDNTPEIEEVGAIFGDDLLTYYAASDCFVFPSYREGFPNTVLEAGAMGLPQIVTDINGSREIVTNLNHNANPNIVGKMDIRDNGIVIPSKDVDALYEAMDRMIVDDVMRENMAENARPMIESRFEQGFVRSCLLNFYEDLMK